MLNGGRQWKLTWDQAQFERFSYILSNGYRSNWAWYKLLQVCARYSQILAVTLIGCQNNATTSDWLSEKPEVESAYSSCGWFREWSVVGGEKDRFCCLFYSYGKKIRLNICHGNSGNSYGCSYLLRICFIYATNVSVSRSWIPLQVVDR